jgi:Protein of unknown function (DUF3592)
MAAAIALFVISLGAIAAGWGYVKTARRMRSYGTVRGRVVKRELAAVAGDTREGRYGKGGGYRPKVTYVFAVDGVEHTSDKTTYAHRGLKKALAEQQLAAIADAVDVYYDPASPDHAYLEKHAPGMGYWFLAGGTFGVLIALVVAFA